MTLVMKEVLSMLINVAYKSSRVLREIQVDGPTDPTLHQQVLKAKYVLRAALILHYADIIDMS